MANISIETPKQQVGDRTEYMLYLAMAYPLCLVHSLMRRVVSKDDQVEKKSVFREAHDVAMSAVPWIFSGR